MVLPQAGHSLSSVRAKCQGQGFKDAGLLTTAKLSQTTARAALANPPKQI